MVGIISVDSTSLAWLGAECDRLAETARPAAPLVSRGFGATQAAVQALHGDVAKAGRRISDRLRMTGELVPEAGADFASTEAINERDFYEV